MNDTAMKQMTVARAMEAVRESDDGLYGVLLEHGSMELGFYKPQDSDGQSPHDQDELYIVHSGTGIFVRGDEQISFAPGDALFVAAEVEHHFIDFSEDFSAWVIFYGPAGGEKP